MLTRKLKTIIKQMLVISAGLFSTIAYSADYLDTQYGQDGLEVHIMKTKINKNIMTVIFAIENTNDTDGEYFALPIPQVFYNTNDKKYPVLKDADGKWLASTIGYSSSDFDIFLSSNYTSKNHTFELAAGKKKIGWVKFEAPQDSDWPLDLQFPSVTPFTLDKPE